MRFCKKNEKKKYEYLKYEEKNLKKNQDANWRSRE